MMKKTIIVLAACLFVASLVLSGCDLLNTPGPPLAPPGNGTPAAGAPGTPVTANYSLPEPAPSSVDTPDEAANLTEQVKGDLQNLGQGLE